VGSLSSCKRATGRLCGEIRSPRARARKFQFPPQSTEPVVYPPFSSQMPSASPSLFVCFPLAVFFSRKRAYPGFFFLVRFVPSFPSKVTPFPRFIPDDLMLDPVWLAPRTGAFRFGGQRLPYVFVNSDCQFPCRTFPGRSVSVERQSWFPRPCFFRIGEADYIIDGRVRFF